MWEIPQQGPQDANYSWAITTAGGLVFYGETGGGFAAVDAKTGKTLWTFHGNQAWRGCPMTYMLNGRQYIAVASGSNNFVLRVTVSEKVGVGRAESRSAKVAN